VQHVHLPVRGDRDRILVGSPERIAQAVRTNVVDIGIDGVIVNLPGYAPGSITELGEALRAVLTA